VKNKAYDARARDILHTAERIAIQVQCAMAVNCFKEQVSHPF
jgi:hypothetical protein